MSKDTKRDTDQTKELYKEFSLKFSGSDGIPTELQVTVFDWVEDKIHQTEQRVAREWEQKLKRLLESKIMEPQEGTLWGDTEYMNPDVVHGRNILIEELTHHYNLND